MALTEIQQVTKEEFLQKIQRYANKFKEFSFTVKGLTDFMVNVDVAELNRMSIEPADQTKLAQLKVELTNFNTFAAGNPVTPSNSLNTIIDGLRTM